MIAINIIKKVVVVLASSVPVLCFSAPTIEEIYSRFDIQSVPVLGKWCDDIDAAVELSKEQSVPIVAVWGNASGGCGHCIQFLDVLDSAEFKTWAETRKVLMCLGDGKYGSLAAKVKKFTQNTPNSLSEFPFAKIYWPKANGKTVEYNFSALMGQMPVKTESTRAGCFIASIEKYIKDYAYIDPTGGPVAISALDKQHILNANSFLFTAYSFVLPLFVTENDGGVRLDGSLSLNISNGNRIKMKYTGASSKSLSLNGAWGTIDLLTGEVNCKLEKDGNEFYLTLNKDGKLSIIVTFASPFFEGTYFASVNLADAACSPQKETYGVSYCINDDPHKTGFGYMLITVKGMKVSIKGVTPDGYAISGNYAVSPRGDDFIIPFFRSTSKYQLSCGLVFTANDSDCDKGISVLGEAYTKSSDDQQVRLCTVEGHLQSMGLGPKAICQQAGLKTDLTFVVGTSVLPDSTLGDVVNIDPIALNASETKFKFNKKGVGLKSISYTKSNGIFSGKIILPFSSGATTVASFKGIINSCCERNGTQLGVGTAYFKDKVGGKSIMRSVPIFIKGVKAE